MNLDINGLHFSIQKILIALTFLTQFSVEIFVTQFFVGPYVCDTCGKAYQRKNSLNCHKRLDCTNAWLFCKEEDCSYKSKRKENLRRHMRVHTRQLTCEKCGKAFLKQHELTSHIENECIANEH